jgi:hypothetical protein
LLHIADNYDQLADQAEGLRRLRAAPIEPGSALCSRALAGEFALKHDSLVAVPRRPDPILEIAILVRQQSHDLELLGPDAMPVRVKGNKLANFDLVSRHWWGSVASHFVVV